MTDFDGRLVDCNEKCAQIFGFASPAEMLAHGAWDFYFDRAERELLLDRLRSQGSSPAEELSYRDRTGRPIRLLISSSLVGSSDGQPALILSTAIEVTPQGDSRLAQPAATEEREVPQRERMAEMSRKLTGLLERAAQILHEDNLPTMSKAEIREVLYVLEEIKMLMSELEVLRLPPM